MSSPNSTSSLISRSATRFHSNSNTFNTTSYQFRMTILLMLEVITLTGILKMSLR
ncbi:hypothetical protein HanXRQr2_Chr08g0327061 [Helianthus annuus]|uniref:Uncharacterized protein n=1 Tax=Helianthus annuus TaxID=4232 RepID=A0A251U374_HELAN|nr:hypothetical protein HanXRQr2_Chr08g0327061 [Helianthus annuus]KAJ0538035.1 hypothetical protein HanHA300_Chr08g0270411 [Helianthus annuus]KAJ0552623.1 hypothetical protein HanHA89_Chr08g0287261 [Helianthus annuus]KAJ0718317.1 hypothetical protein HanLR1_Chr08g0269271 [Helianthus annuus]KAJ0900656.1 hypothetical protein HanPSC8_Chr08g0316261 [Helianthus annuus]